MAVKPTLCLVLIARNEQRCIARCLESVRPWVDDMVVLDTGSTDDTMVIARTCGARVFEAPWPNDFSVARNASLDLSNAD
jgi:glycosyltransferase involved in cell wall biosynthesis